MSGASTWIVVTDARTCTLYSCRRGEHPPHLSEVTAMTSVHENSHEHQRPTLVGGAERRGSVASSGAHAAPHTVGAERPEEDIKRFAREVASLVAAVRAQRGAERVSVFAPTRMLGVLKETKMSLEGVALHDAELTHLRPHELAQHQRVIDAINGP